MDRQLALAQFPGCHGCGGFAAAPARTCLECATRVIEQPGPGACPLCAQLPVADVACRNELCRSPRRRIGAVHAIGYQSGALRRSIHQYKYAGVRSWSVVFGRLLLAWLEAHMTETRPDLIVANPGFAGPGGPVAHAEAVLAAAAAADAAWPGDHGGARWPFDTGNPAAVVKTRPTLRSADGQAWSKRASGWDLREALAIPDAARTAGRFVLVFDDICTTGTQLDSVAGCLLAEGSAARVEGIVLARAPWRTESRLAGRGDP